MINYPLNLNTDYKRLLAVYVLLEQMRQEHNRVGAIARAGWNEGKWKEYARIFNAKQLPLLQEQNRLRDAIRRVNYTDRQWIDLPESTRRSILPSLYGDKQTLKLQGTTAISSELNELKLVDYELLVGDFIDPPENLTTFTEVDPNSDLTVSANTVTAEAGFSTNTALWVTKSYGAGHFGNFEHLFKYNVSSFVACLWSIAGDYHTELAMNTANNGIRASAWNVTYFKDETNGNSDSGTTGVDVNRWITVARSGTTATYKIYSDSGRTTLLDTLTITCGTQTYEYLNMPAAIEGGGETAYIHYLGDLDIQEGGGGWTGIAKVYGVGQAFIGSVNGVLKASIAKIMGKAV